MQFEFTEEQRMISDMAADFCRAEAGSEKVRQAMASEAGYLPETWQSMVTQLGLDSLLIPEAYGGQGLTLVEAVLVFQEMGKMLLPSPLLSTSVVGVGVLASLNNARLLNRLAAEDITCSLAVTNNGSASFVLDGHADLLLIFEETIEKVFLVEKGHVALDVRPVNTLDQTRRFSDIRVSGDISASEIGNGSSARTAIESALNMGRIALAAESAGAAQRCLELTVGYSKERVQFGREIGSFQAVKHQMADMMIEVEAAASAVYFAACAVSEDHEESGQLAAMAKVQASEALEFCAGRMIQLHGGIGFTWEHDAHLFFKRARSTKNLFGANAALDEMIASSIGLAQSA